MRPIEKPKRKRKRKARNHNLSLARKRGSPHWLVLMHCAFLPITNVALTVSANSASVPLLIYQSSYLCHDLFVKLWRQCFEPDLLVGQAFLPVHI